MRQSVLLLFISSLFFYGCKKDDFHRESFSGIVLHTVTKQPLANQEIVLVVENVTYGKKDPEFPSGRPEYSRHKYSTRTDNSGHYSFNDIEVNSNWSFYLQLIKGEYIQNYISGGSAGPIYYVPRLPRKTGDTLYGERPGIVRYNIKNINTTFDNDTLTMYPSFVSTLIKITPGPVFPVYDPNWTFIGKAVDVSRTDTFPAESNTLIPIQWLHRRIDTILYKSEHILISPNTVTEYNIYY